MIGVNTRENRVEEKDVVINHDTGRIWVDGEEILFLIESEGPAVGTKDGALVVHIPLMVLAKSVIIIDTRENA